VAAVVGALRPGTRVAYVMTDGAALPLVLSDLVAGLRERGLLTTTITAGNAFGGDLEAVNVPSALTLARHAPGSRADVIVVGMGPGVVGTGSRLGNTAIEAASVLEAAEDVGGTPILCIRASDGDARDRHRGVSHHTETVIGMTGVRPLVAPVPEEVRGFANVAVCEVDAPDVAAILDAAGLRITTMGRGIEDDPLFFRAAGAAAAVAVARLGLS
jgi:hypothetical protein